MTDRENVIKLINIGKENDCCDFKKTFYVRDKYGEMIKDIVAFANNTECEDKYIIFNVDDDTHKVGTEKFENIPDVSTINELIRGYVEPYIDIELGEFDYESSKIVYIKVLQKNIDRPYVIKKDKAQNGKCQVKQGDIFIRKNATNFKANRDDLDNIYDMREKRRVVIDTMEVKNKECCIDNVMKEIFIVSFIFENHSKNNYLLNEVDVLISVKNHSFCVNGAYLISTDNVSSDKIFILKDAQFSINPYFIEKKSIGFELSDGYIKKMKETYGQNIDCNICIKMKDVNGYEVESDCKECTIVLM